MKIENLTPEMIARAMEAGTSEELRTLAAQAGINLTDDQAAQAFARLHMDGGLSAEELANVSGGFSNFPEIFPRDHGC